MLFPKASAIRAASIATAFCRVINESPAGLRKFAEQFCRVAMEAWFVYLLGVASRSAYGALDR
jgi:hypothetical protein